MEHRSMGRESRRLWAQVTPAVHLKTSELELRGRLPLIRKRRPTYSAGQPKGLRRKRRAAGRWG